MSERTINCHNQMYAKKSKRTKTTKAAAPEKNTKLPDPGSDEYREMQR